MRQVVQKHLQVQWRRYTIATSQLWATAIVTDSGSGYCESGGDADGAIVEWDTHTDKNKE